MIKWSTPAHDTMEERTSPRKSTKETRFKRRQYVDYINMCNVEKNKKKELRKGPTLKKKHLTHAHGRLQL